MANTLLRLMGLIRNRSRKYPVRRDEYGRSARQRCFIVFDGGRGPAEASLATGISKRTARRYFAAWKKLPPNMGLRYRMVRAMHRSHPEFTHETIRMLGAELGMTGVEVLERLDDIEKPWGIRRLVTGDWPRYLLEERRREREQRRSQAEIRVETALEIVCLEEQLGVPLEQIVAALDALRPEQEDKGERVAKEEAGLNP